MGRWQRAVIFACRTLEPIVAQQDTAFVSILKAPNLGGEILNARLIAVDKLPREQRRFPDQLDWLQSRLDQVPESEVRWQADFVAQGNALHQVEIPLMQRLQQWLGPDVWWLSVSNLFGSGGFQLALIPLLLPLLGWPRLRQLLFAMLWLGLLVQASKEGIGWPRPFHLQPELATQSAQGFGMPSGHTASALLVLGGAAWLALACPARAGLFAGLAAGAHHRSGAGLARGALYLRCGGWPADWRLAAGGSPILAAGSVRFRLGLADRCGTGLRWLESVGPSGRDRAGGAGPLAWGRVTLVRDGYSPWLTGAVVLAGMLLMVAGAWALPLLTSSSLAILLGQFVLFFGLGLWLSAGLWWILSFLKCDTRPKGNGSDKGTL